MPETVAPIRILVAEDEAIIRMDLREMLEEEGFDVVAEASDAAQAGAMAYLVKPFQKSDLVPAIEIALERYRDLATLRNDVTDLSERLETRKVVERAKGVLMEQGMTEADSY